jgi:hypothetical protein
MVTFDKIPVCRFHSVNMPSVPLRHDTYTDYLGSLLPQWPEYRGLHEFLQEDQPPDLVSNTQALIIDSTTDGLITRRFDEIAQFQSALDQRSSNTRIRLILISYQDIQTLKKGFVDTVGLKFDIDPLFFCNHLGTGLLDPVRNRWDRIGISTYSLLSSHNPSFELGQLLYLHASVLLLETEGEGTRTQSTSTYPDRCTLSF